MYYKKFLKLIYFKKFYKKNMSKTIFIKSIEGNDIEFNKYNLCSVSEWFDETISNMDENDESIIDEKCPSLSEKCLQEFKNLCEINHYSSSQKKINLSKTIKIALPAIEKWACSGLLNLWYNDINNSYKLKVYNYSDKDILKYESLILDEQKIYWEYEVLSELAQCSFETISKLKHFTLCQIVEYKRRLVFR